jgi:predicted peptidase
MLSRLFMLIFAAQCIGASARGGENPAQRAVSLPEEVAQKTKHLGRDYWLYTPASNDTDKPLPLLFFLHGKGESGEAIKKVLKHGVPKRLAAGKTLPFIVVSPQCKPKENGKYRWNTDDLDVLLAHIKTTHRIDEDRIYLTGMSLGGIGTWAWVIKRPNTFAAIAPVCGAGNPKKTEAIAHVPAWVFHGAKDDKVPVQKSKDMVAALKQHGSSVKLTIYPEVGHDSWNKAYDNPALYQWLAAQRRRK